MRFAPRSADAETPPWFVPEPRPATEQPESRPARDRPGAVPASGRPATAQPELGPAGDRPMTGPADDLPKAGPASGLPVAGQKPPGPEAGKWAVARAAIGGRQAAAAAKGRQPARGGFAGELPDRPQQRRVSQWAAARCDEIAGDVVRGGLWRFTEVVADVLYPGLGHAVAAAQRVTKWGPQLVGLNDERGADVKVGLVGSENLGLWVLFRTRLGQSDPGPRPAWCTDLPVGPLGGEGVRRDCRVISGIEDVKPADVAALLLVPPAAGADTRLLARVDVRRRAGVLAVDPGDGSWQRRLFFTVVHPPGRGNGQHERYRVVCPVCGRRRLAQFRGFDVCSDCGWLDTGAGSQDARASS